MKKLKAFSFLLSLLLLITLIVTSCTNPKKDTSSKTNVSSAIDSSANDISFAVSPMPLEISKETSNALSEEESITFSERDISYIAFGDSISRGARLSDPVKQCYPSLLTSLLDFVPGVNDVAYANFSIDGQTSSGLLTLLSSKTDAIAAADIITISTGANNILGVMVNKTVEILKSNGFTTTSIYNTSEIFVKLFSGTADTEMYQNVINAFSQINTYINSNEFNNEIDAAAEKLSQDLPAIIKLIRKHNKTAVIAVNTIYNPYKNLTISAGITTLFNPSQVTETAVTKLNDVIKNLSVELGYTIAEVHDEFDNYNGDERLENAFFSLQAPDKTEIDVHPTENGQKIIADVVFNAIRSPLKNKLKSDAGVTES